MNESDIIYLDNNATTPCDPGVVEKMLPWLTEHFANPSSSLHIEGRHARNAVEFAREQVALLVNALPEEIFFTGSATESCNIAILGAGRLIEERIGKRQLLTTAIEHEAVLGPIRQLGREGFQAIELGVDSQGKLHLDQLDDALKQPTSLVSVQAANNEIGVLQDIPEVSRRVHEAGALFHVDASQAVGKIAVDLDEWDADLVSFSAHKLYGPKGIGALIIRGGLHSLPLPPLFFGGGQESGLRPGTENVPAIVGFGKACELALEYLPKEIIRLSALRNLLEEELRKVIPGLQINGHPTDRLPGTTSLRFPGINAEALIASCPELCLSTGSACRSGTPEPSYVLTSIGLQNVLCYESVRVSVGRFVTKEEILGASKVLSAAFRKLQAAG